MIQWKLQVWSCAANISDVISDRGHLMVLLISVFSPFPLSGMSVKVYRPICFRCWTCVLKSPSKGSSVHSTCTWALPCLFGNTQGNISSLALLRLIPNAAETQTGLRTRPRQKTARVLVATAKSILRDFHDLLPIKCILMMFFSFN